MFLQSVLDMFVLSRDVVAFLFEQSSKSFAFNHASIYHSTVDFTLHPNQFIPIAVNFRKRFDFFLAICLQPSHGFDRFAFKLRLKSSNKSIKKFNIVDSYREDFYLVRLRIFHYLIGGVVDQVVILLTQFLLLCDKVPVCGEQTLRLTSRQYRAFAAVARFRTVGDAGQRLGTR